jgi:hypothetical protein
MVCLIMLVPFLVGGSCLFGSVAPYSIIMFIVVVFCCCEQNVYQNNLRCRFNISGILTFFPAVFSLPTSGVLATDVHCLNVLVCFLFS